MRRRMPGRRASRGLSLVELLVSLVIGLFVVGAVLVTYLGTGASATQRAQISQMTEDAQMALSQMTRDLQMAGYTDVASVVTSVSGETSTFVRPGAGFRPVFACNGAFANPSAALWSATCAAAPAAGQTLEVSYQATPSAASLTAAGDPTDCIGNSLANPATRRDESAIGMATLMFTSNRYYINTASARPELYCASPASPGGQPIVENVQDMRLWFGIAPNWSASDPVARQPVRFLAPQDMGPDDWKKAVSVRLCLLMRTAEPVLAGELSGTFRYRDCQGNDNLASPDGRIYRAFHTTVALRNRAGF